MSSILSNFDELEQSQESSLEYYFTKLAVIDEQPIIITPREYKNMSKSEFEHNRVYIVMRGIEDFMVIYNPITGTQDKGQHKRIMIGCSDLDENFKSITTADLCKYIEIYRNTYPLNSSIVNKMFKKFITNNPYTYNIVTAQGSIIDSGGFPSYFPTPIK